MKKRVKLEGKVFPMVGGALLLLAAVLFWEPLSGWFAGPQRPGAATGAGAGHEGHAALGDEVVAKLGPVFVHYEVLRAELADDSLEGVPQAAQAAAQGLEEARALAGEEASPALEAGAKAAVALRDASNLEAARGAFGHLSEALVALAARAPSLQKGRIIFECPMAEGFNKWFQTTEPMANPYMGTRMLKCGSRSDWSAPGFAAGGQGHAGHGDIAHYVCPMHPSVKQATPGTCPLCGMDLVPVTKEELESGVVLVDQARRQRIGVKTAKVEKRPMTVSVRALGKVTWDETGLQDVTVRVMGWVHDLEVDATGQHVKKGQVLFTFYSPELLSAQQELLLAARRHPDTNDPLLRAARQRLRLWGMTDGQIDRVIATGEAQEQVPVVAPATGYVMEKEIVAGAQVMPGMRLYRLAPLDRVWIEADVYEGDLLHVKVGQPVSISLPYAATGERLEGKVSYVYPWLDSATRTGKVRVTLPNKDGRLKPDMYANLSFTRDVGERLQIPASAVVYTGPRRLVFVDMGEDRLRPQVVELGIRGEHSFEVTGGLSEGDVVVTSGNFLIAAETRLRSGADHWGSQP